jgi:hypothetical protein
MSTQGKPGQSVTPNLDLHSLHELTKEAVRRQQAVEFAGFLVGENKDSLYIADLQGTWVIARTDALRIEDWTVGVPESMQSSGRPVRVVVRNEATIYEIRPWKMIREHAGDAERAIEAVFSLGGEPLPATDSTELGSNQIAELERHFARRLGWTVNEDPANDSKVMRRRPRSVSKTEVVNDGYCDQDEGF